MRDGLERRQASIHARPSLRSWGVLRSSWKLTDATKGFLFLHNLLFYMIFYILEQFSIYRKGSEAGTEFLYPPHPVFPDVNLWRNRGTFVKGKKTLVCYYPLNSRFYSSFTCFSTNALSLFQDLTRDSIWHRLRHLLAETRFQTFLVFRGPDSCEEHPSDVL